jgi:hypothetical protein
MTYFQHVAAGTINAVFVCEETYSYMILKIAIVTGVVCALLFVPSFIGTVTLFVKALRVSTGKSRRSVVLNR